MRLSLLAPTSILTRPERSGLTTHFRKCGGAAAIEGRTDLDLTDAPEECAAALGVFGSRPYGLLPIFRMRHRRSHGCRNREPLTTGSRNFPWLSRLLTRTIQPWSVHDSSSLRRAWCGFRKGHSGWAPTATIRRK